MPLLPPLPGGFQFLPLNLSDPDIRQVLDEIFPLSSAPILYVSGFLTQPHMHVLSLWPVPCCPPSITSCKFVGEAAGSVVLRVLLC
jgi:hypothetical protein